jgi:hypothetical protein
MSAHGIFSTLGKKLSKPMYVQQKQLYKHVFCTDDLAMNKLNHIYYDNTKITA